MVSPVFHVLCGEALPACHIVKVVIALTIAARVYIKLITENTPVRYARTTNSHRSFALPENFMEWHPTCHQNDELLMKLGEDFINAEPTEDMLFYLWGHSFEFDKYESWERFEAFCELISGRREITYMTNGEVYRYIIKSRK